MADFRGKVALVTGATNGIGKVTARELARMGAATVIIGRKPERVQQTVDDIKQAAGHTHIEGMVADLSLMSQVRAAADQFKRTYDRLDVLVNNAGTGASKRVITEEGFERMFALNHLSYFLLTNLLLDVMKASALARIVNLSSDAHRTATLDLDNLQGGENWGPGGYNAYGRTKLENVLFTRELARRLNGTGVTVNAVHPGVVATGLWRSAGGIFGNLIGLFAPLYMKTPEQGAQTSIYVATAPEIAAMSGFYFTDSQPVAPSKAAQDDEAARRLWAISAELVGLTEAAAV